MVELCRPTSLLRSAKPNAFAVARDFLEDRKRAAQRLHAAARALLGLVVDVGLARWHQPCDRDLAVETLRGVAGLSLVFSLVRDFTGINSPGERGELYQAVLARQQRRASR